MSTETFLQFWHAHLNTIIGVLIVSVLALLGVYLFLEFVKEKNQTKAGGGASADFGQIEESLKKLLENTHLPSKAASEDDGKASAAATKELEQLRSLMSEKDSLIKKLQETAKSAAGAAASDAGGSAELESKIKDLEARLAEYEIIEDDIADLSMYKEENSNLKEEIAILKKQVGGGAPAPAPKAAKPVAPVATPPPAQAEEPEEQEAAADPVEDSSESANGIDLGDDIMAEFAAAVQEQKRGMVPPVDKGNVPEDKAKPAVEEAELEVSADTSAEDGGDEDSSMSSSDQEAADKILAALSGDSGDDEGTPLPPDPVAEAAAQIDLDSLTPDPEKMLGEIEELNASVHEDDGSDALAAGIDTDKMLNEVDDLNASIGADEAGEQKKLAGEFDNFLKES